MTKLARLTSTLHTRGFALAASVVSFVCALCYFLLDSGSACASEPESVSISPDRWLAPGWLNFACAMACSATTVIVMLLLNKVHNIMRALTYLYVPLFLGMQLATPDVMTSLSTATMLAAVIPLCMYLLFECYRDPSATRQVFLISFLLSSFSITQYCYAIYIPAMLIGCAQMRIFNRRTVAASLMGIVTPWILVFGFGIIDPAGIRIPEFRNILSGIDFDDTYLMLVAAAFTVVTMLVCYTLNVLRTIAYNAHARAVNGAFSVVMLFTLAALCIDIRNAALYIPLLNYSAAISVTHYFSTHRSEKSFIAIISILAVYAVLYVCQIKI